MNRIDIPDNTESLHNIGAYIMEYQPLQNAFMNALVNRIGRVLITSRMWNNPLSVFKQGTLEMGETVEEIFVNIAKPHSFDPVVAEKEIYKREIPDVRAAFHTMNFQKFYKQTISNDQLRQAFLSYQGITDLIAKIVDAMYTAMQYDEYVVMKYMVCREALNGGIYAVVTPNPLTSATTAAGAIKKYRAMSSKLTFLSDKYNKARVKNSTPREEQYILIDAELNASVDVDVLAQAYNMSKTDWLGHVIEIDSFAEHDDARLAELFANDGAYQPFDDGEIENLATISSITLDKKWWMVFDNFQQFTENYNGQGLYWQYWYHAWKTFSVSPYANAVLFTSTNTTITGVTVAPASATVLPRTSAQFKANVAGAGFIDTSIEWMIAGQKSSDTRIDGSTGVLYVGEDETAASIQVIAIAVDGTTGNATVSTSE